MDLQTLADAVKMMKYSIHKVGNQTDHRKDADKSIIRSVEALRREVGPQTSNSEGQNISYGLRRLHDIYLSKTDIFSQAMSGKTITIKCWIGKTITVPAL